LEYRVLTTVQLFELHFDSYTRARDRLLRLYRMGVLWRARPRRIHGSLPFHYMLDDLGAFVVAESRGVEVADLQYRFERTLGMVDSLRLRHLRETNGFFTRLVYACRRGGDEYHLSAWWSERRSAERWDGFVRPDGLGRVEGSEGSVTFALELDRGSENRGRLAAKLDRYRLVRSGRDAPDVILFCFPSETRERSARDVLGHSGLRVATSVRDRHVAEPLGSVWWPVPGDRRVRMMDLGRGGDRG
jgi:hypothetical protein